MNRAEALTAQFYSWEKRCRGWEVYPIPIDLEPPFRPFFAHSINNQVKYVDDGLRPTLFTRFTSLFKSGQVSGSKEYMDDQGEDADLDPYPFINDEPLISWKVSLPQDSKVTMDGMEQLLVMLGLSQFPVSFEIIATHSNIRLQFVCRQSDAQNVYAQIKAYFPGCGIQEGNPDDIIPDDKGGLIIDFGLSQEFMRPLSVPKNFNLDPYIGLFGILENLKPDEHAVVQIIFQGAVNPWAESILHSVMDNAGDSFFANDPEMVKIAEEKISSPLFGVIIRILGLNQSTNDESLAHTISSVIIQASDSVYNNLVPLNGDGYDINSYVEDVMFRQSHRLGMLLNAKELANLVHFPSESVVSYKLERDTRKTKKAPSVFIGHKLVLGTNIHQGIETPVTIADNQRLKHTHVIGATGTGKSTLLFSSIVQDIANGEGIAVLDPHGDLIESVISWIHPNRHKDVILIDPADSEFPVGFNILTAHSEIEKDILSSDLVAVFKRLSTSWGDQMNSVFANAILAFLESSKGGTLVDLRRFLIEKAFREEFLKTVKDPSIVYYWQKEFPILKSSSIGPILTRLDSFLRPKLVRNMVAQNKSLDFEDILDSKKILLIKLSQGLIGAENSYLLGTFIVSKIQMAAMARQAKAKADRSNFYLYIDEFQNFITPSMSAILSGARKYHLGLILAHQDMQQLNKNDSELASSVVANAGTRICFRVGDMDAKKFEGNFSYFDAADLQNLDTGEAIIRIERPENDCNMVTIPFEELDPEIAQTCKELVIATSRAAYGTPKNRVEEVFQSEQVVPEIPANITETLPTVEHIDSYISPKIEPVAQNVDLLKEAKALKDKSQGTQHRYLQTLVKKMAESRGYIAILEEPTSDGKGRVDVSLERSGKRIAVEIKDTTKDEWELQNITKCLNSGYDMVVECSTDKKALERIKSKALSEQPEIFQNNNVHFLTPDEFFLLLDNEIAKEASTEKRVKGYRVKVDYGAVPESEMTRKRDSVAKSVISSLKGKKK